MRLAEDALTAATTLFDPAGTATAHLNAGWANSNLGHYAAAVVSLNEARRGFAALDDTDGVLKTVNALGVLATRIGEYEQARDFFLEEQRIAESGDYPERLVASLGNLGELSVERGELEIASEYFRSAMAVAESSSNREAQAAIHINLGRVCVDRGEVDTAERELRSAVVIARELGDRIAEAEALTQLSRALARLPGGDDESERVQHLAIAICEEINYPAGVIPALAQRGEFLVDRGRLAEAEGYLRRSAELARKTDSPIVSFARLHRLVELYDEAGNERAAIDLARWLLELERDHAGAATARQVRSVRAAYEIEQAKMEAEIVRLRNVELREKTELLERSNAKLQLMHRIGSELTATLELEEIAQRLHDRLNELMNVDVFGIAFYREDEDVLDFAHVIEDEQRITPFSIAVDSDESFGSWVVRNRKEICLNDSERDYQRYIQRRKPFTAKLCRSIVYMPLELEGRIIGALTVQSSKKNRYREEEMDLLRLLLPYIAVAIDNSRKVQTISTLNRALEDEKGQLQSAYARIAHMANHDILTQLPNRRLLVELLHEYIPLARRQARSFGLLYVDLDDFKPINDTFGHDAGDQVLVRVSERLRSAVRQSDTVSRIGGDEFVLVIRDVSGQADVEAVAEKVLAAIMHPITIKQQVCKLSASIGLSMFPTHGENYDELLIAADRAMYEAKQQEKSGIAISGRGSYRSRSESSDESIESPSNRNRPST